MNRTVFSGLRVHALFFSITVYKPIHCDSSFLDRSLLIVSSYSRILSPTLNFFSLILLSYCCFALIFSCYMCSFASWWRAFFLAIPAGSRRRNTLVSVVLSGLSAWWSYISSKGINPVAVL